MPAAAWTIFSFVPGHGPLTSVNFVTSAQAGCPHYKRRSPSINTTSPTTQISGAPLTCPCALAPAVHTSPLLPINSECPLPSAALTNFTSCGAPRSLGRRCLGLVSAMSFFAGTPSAAGAFRPKGHAPPSTSSTMKWQAAQDVWTETTLTLASARRRCGSRRSGLCEWRAVEGVVGINDRLARVGNEKADKPWAYLVSGAFTAPPFGLRPSVDLRASDSSVHGGGGARSWPRARETHQSVPPQIKTWEQTIQFNFPRPPQMMSQDIYLCPISRRLVHWRRRCRRSVLVCCRRPCRRGTSRCGSAEGGKLSAALSQWGFHSQVYCTTATCLLLNGPAGMQIELYTRFPAILR